MKAKSLITPLAELAPAELEEIKFICQFKAMKLERKSALLRNKFTQGEGRTLMLKAARAVLNQLRDTAAQCMEFLQASEAPSMLIAEQQSLMEKYQRELERLPMHSFRIPEATELMQMQLKLDAMAAHRQNYLMQVGKIEELLAG